MTPLTDNEIAWAAMLAHRKEGRMKTRIIIAIVRWLIGRYLKGWNLHRNPCPKAERVTRIAPEEWSADEILRREG